MKKLNSLMGIALSATLIITLTSFNSNPSESQVQSDESITDPSEVQESFSRFQDGMHLIIGAFRSDKNAVRYANSLNIDGKKPVVKILPENNLFYVAAHYSFEDLDFMRAKRSEFRATEEFFDAWIMYVGQSLDDILAKRAASTEKSEEIVLLEEPEPEQEIILEDPNQEIALPPPDPSGSTENIYKYRFNVVNATNLREVPGYVMIIDAARNKAMRTVSTNEVHDLAAPNSQSKEIIAICEIFGFAKEQVIMKIDDPMSSPDKTRISHEEGGVVNVDFQMDRQNQVGDILTMYNVYFYTNAAIMKPESKFELNSLLAMLEENEKLKIRIHGHTNGNASGKIIKLKDDDTNFFTITRKNDQSVGSAKALSKYRADVIQRWLVEQGIDEDRMEIKAWGGKKMIYSKTDAMAGRNVRVEIEILRI